MRKITIAAIAIIALVVIPSCTADVSNKTSKQSLESSAASIHSEQEKIAGLQLSDTEVSKVFCDFFQSRWQTIEGAADKMAKPEGNVFFVDLDNDGTPELFLTYSTGGGKQTGILAYDISGMEPLELGNAYLAVAPLDKNSLTFTLWGSGDNRVLYTVGEVPHGAVDSTRYFVESFLTLSDGKISEHSLAHSISENGEISYSKGPPENETLTKADYESLRYQYLLTKQPLKVIETGKAISFIADKESFMDRIREGLASWRHEVIEKTPVTG